MTTEIELKTKFLAELKELFDRYGKENYPVQIAAEDHYMGYPECGEDVRMTITIPEQWDEKGETTRPGCDIDLGSRFP